MNHPQKLVAKFGSLKVNQWEFVYLKFLVLFSLDLGNRKNFQMVEGVQDRVSVALLGYTLCSYSRQRISSSCHFDYLKSR